MGRAFRYQRRLTHIVITVAEKKAAETADAGEQGTAATTAGRPKRKPAAKKATAKKSAAKKAVAA
jgi:large subunit ribosomal protein L22